MEAIDERLHAHMIATVSGASRRSYGLFLGLAEDEQARPLIADQLQFLGLIDLQDTVIGRKARNTGHKALRARAVTDLADLIGWEGSHGVYYMGVPDMAIGPLYYSLYDAVCVLMGSEFAEAGARIEEANRIPLTPDEVEEMVRQLMEAGADTVWDLLTTHLRNGRSVRSLGDAIQIGAAELILRTTVPRQFTNAQHPFRLLQCGKQLAAHEQQPVPPEYPLFDGELCQRCGSREQADRVGHREGDRWLRASGPHAQRSVARTRRSHHDAGHPAH